MWHRPVVFKENRESPELEQKGERGKWEKWAGTRRPRALQASTLGEKRGEAGCVPARSSSPMVTSGGWLIALLLRQGGIKKLSELSGARGERHSPRGPVMRNAGVGCRSMNQNSPAFLGFFR